jgi:hypothetical protein
MELTAASRQAGRQRGGSRGMGAGRGDTAGMACARACPALLHAPSLRAAAARAPTARRVILQVADNLRIYAATISAAACITQASCPTHKIAARRRRGGDRAARVGLCAGRPLPAAGPGHAALPAAPGRAQRAGRPRRALVRGPARRRALAGAPAGPRSPRSRLPSACRPALAVTMRRASRVLFFLLAQRRMLWVWSRAGTPARSQRAVHGWLRALEEPRACLSARARIHVLVRMRAASSQFRSNSWQRRACS